MSVQSIGTSRAMCPSETDAYAGASTHYKHPRHDLAAEIQLPARKASTALLPPNAKELESMVRTSTPRRAALGT
jgi:hypothetical protein